MDEVDYAQARSDLFLDQALEKARSSLANGLGVDFCVDCGEPIPSARRRAVPGCVRCIDCQEEFEQRSNSTE